MKKAGCVLTTTGLLLLLVIGGYGINGCFNVAEQPKREGTEQRDATAKSERARLATTSISKKDIEDVRAEEAKREKARISIKEDADREQKERFDAREDEAKEFSKTCVLKFLKYPDDATFGFWDTVSAKHNEDRDGFACEGKVKAKNAFGAELTHRWLAIVVFKEGKWKLAKLSISEAGSYESPELMAWIESRNAARIRSRKAKEVAASLSQQLTVEAGEKARADSDVEVAKQRVAELEQASEAILRDNAAYRVAKDAVEHSESKVKRLRLQGDAANLASASSQWMESKGNLQKIASQATDAAGLATAKTALGKARIRVISANARIAKLNKDIMEAEKQ